MRKWLKHIRLLKKLTHEELAKQICISRAHYTHIELSQRNPSIELAKELSRALDFGKYNISWTKFYENQEKLNTATESTELTKAVKQAKDVI